MKKQVFFGSLVVFMILAFLGCKKTTPFHPDISFGGRAVSIAVDPGDVQHIFVASETGGLFETKDGGVHWKHIDNLPNASVTDIAFAPDNSDIVVATALSEYKISNNGGVWLSKDRGTTWAQPAGSIPSPGPRCPDNAGAHSVSFEPGTTHVYVGTDGGLAVSTDLGDSWTHLVPDPAFPLNDEKTQDRVWSVLAQSEGRLSLSAHNGLWYSIDDGISWQRAAIGPGGGQGGVNHAFAASSLNTSHIFHAGGGQQLYLTTDGGVNWTLVPSPSVWNRPVFVRAARAVSQEENKVDVYFGNGVGIYRQTFTLSGAGLVGSGSWTPLVLDHADPADVAFDLAGRCPILLASDGGIHKTTDYGSSWTLSGGGKDGYNALQITEVTGQSVSGEAPHQDLYFGTQDNNLFASADGGSTWPNSICCEGFFIRTGPTSVDHSGTKVTGVTCGACGNFITDPHFAHFNWWPNPADGDSDPNDIDGNPIFLKPGHYLQLVNNKDASPSIYSYLLTQDTGSTWLPAYSITLQPWGLPQIAGPASNPTLYQPVRRPGETSDGLQRIGLLRITNLYGPGSPVVQDADKVGFGSLGIFPTMFAWYIVLGTDPHDPLHLMMADIESDTMKVSYDGGETWYTDMDLTNLVTEAGSFQFRKSLFPLVSSIVFDPFFPCHVLVGTVQNGVLDSLDGGSTWAKIPSSTRIVNLSSFYCPPKGRVVVSSYGRGLWKIKTKRNEAQCVPIARILVPPQLVPITIVDPATGARVQPKDLWDPEICPTCQYVIVKNGRIVDMDLEEGLRVKTVYMTGGSIHQFNNQQKEIPLEVPNVYSIKRGVFGENKVLLTIAKEGTPIRGLLLEKDILKGIIIADAELPVTPARIPYIHITGDTMIGGMATVASGGTIVIYGQGFVDGLKGKNPLIVRLGDEILEDNILVDAEGKLRFEFKIQRLPGTYDVLLEQKEGNRTLRDKIRVKVVPRDSRKSEDAIQRQQ